MDHIQWINYVNAPYRYFGLSSTGISRKSGGAAFGSNSFDTGDRYKGASSTREGDRFSDSYKDDHREERDSYRKADQGGKTEKKGSELKMGSARSSRLELHKLFSQICWKIIHISS